MDLYGVFATLLFATCFFFSVDSLGSVGFGGFVSEIRISIPLALVGQDIHVTCG